MTDASPTPPASPNGTKSTITTATPNPEPSRADLVQELDALLERYLNLLDEQQSMQNELGKYMSSGFLSLARANQSCPPGRWYGRDYYDERMKAVRKIEITHRETKDTLMNAEQENEKDEKGRDDKEQQCQAESQRSSAPSFKTVMSTPTEPPTPDSSAPSMEISEKESNTEAEPTVSDSEKPKNEGNARSTSTKTPPAAPTNPLRWFGVLVPPALRAAQGSFTSAIEGPVPALVSVIAEMHEVEVKVDKLRRLLFSSGEERDMVALS